MLTLENSMKILEIIVYSFNVVHNYDIMLLGGDIMAYFNPNDYTRYKIAETEQNNNGLGKQSYVSGWKITGISTLIILSYFLLLFILN